MTGSLKPSPGAEGSYGAAKCFRSGCIGWEADDRGSKKKASAILNQLRQLPRRDTAGDPTGRRGLWTGQRLEQISHQLKRLGLSVCPNTVRRLLDELGYALHAQRKSLSGPQSPERDRQFR